MLEYALNQDSKTLKHIDSVENGLKCNCVCSGCGDKLVAKNNGSSDTRHHFAHYSRDESSNCLMTQLHLVTQYFFQNTHSLYLPPISFQYKNKTLNQAEKIIDVYRGDLEVRIGSYIADVLLETSIGNLVIEVFVTHKNGDRKTAYYQQKKIPSLEFDLSTYLNQDIEVALSDLKNNKVSSKWLYEWCKEDLINRHEKVLEEESKRIKLKRLRSAKDSARKFIQGNYILLPSLTQEFECMINGHKYYDEVTIFSRREQPVNSVRQIEITDESLILQGIYGQSYIWVAIILKDYLPKEVESLEGSVIIRTPSTSDNDRATWKWLKYPKLEHRVEQARQRFLSKSHIEANKAITTKEAVKKAEIQSNLYLLSQDNLFKRDYSRWSKWMEINRLFKPHSPRKHPKLPPALTYIRSYPDLWPFNCWSILTLSLLAKIVDNKPKNTKIFYTHLFNELSELTGLHNDFYTIEQRIAPHAVDKDKKSLVLRSEIVEEALRAYFNVGVIFRMNGGCRRIGSLMEAIDLDSYIYSNH